MGILLSAVCTIERYVPLDGRLGQEVPVLEIKSGMREPSVGADI